MLSASSDVVRPFFSLRRGTAPASHKALSHFLSGGQYPLSATPFSGVKPSLTGTFGFAPASKSMVTISVCRRDTAQCSAVSPLVRLVEPHPGLDQASDFFRVVAHDRMHKRWS